MKHIVSAFGTCVGVVFVLILAGCEGGAKETPLVISSLDGPSWVNQGGIGVFNVTASGDSGITYAWTCNPPSAGTLIDASLARTVFQAGQVDNDTFVVVSVTVQSSSGVTLIGSMDVLIREEPFPASLEVGEIVGPTTIRDRESAGYSVHASGDIGIKCRWSCDPSSAGTFSNDEQENVVFEASDVQSDTPVTIKVEVSSHHSQYFISRVLEVTLDEWGTPLNPLDVTPPWMDLSAEDVVLDGDYAYVMHSKGELHTLDRTDEANPAWLGSVTTGHDPLLMCAASGYVYILSGFVPADVILEIVDVRQPGNPRLAGNLGFLAEPEDMVAAEGYVYVANGGGGLCILDVDPPEEVHVETMVSFPEYALSVAIEGDFAYVGAVGRLIVVDIDPVASAHVANDVDLPGIRCAVTELHEGMIYTLSGYGNALDLFLIAFDAFGNGQVVLNVDLSLWSATGFSCMAISDGHLILLGDDLAIAPIETLEPHVIPHVVDPEMMVTSLGVSDGSLWIPMYHRGIDIWDVSTPESAFLAGHIEPVSGVLAIAASDGLAYVLTETELVICDVAFPDSARILASLEAPDYSVDCLALSEGYVFLGGHGTSRVWVVDVDPPEAVCLVGDLSPGFPPTAMAALDGYLFIGGDEVLAIADIGEPQAPEIESVLTVSEGVTDIAVANGYAYLAGNDADYQESTILEIVDIDPIPGPLTGTCVLVSDSWPEAGLAVAVSGGYAYVSTSQWIRVVDVREPSSMHVTYSLPIRGCSDIAVDGRYAYAVKYQDGLHILDTSDPDSAPIEVAQFPVRGALEGIVVSGRYAYMSYVFGLRILKLW